MAAPAKAGEVTAVGTVAQAAAVAVAAAVVAVLWAHRRQSADRLLEAVQQRQIA